MLIIKKPLSHTGSYLEYPLTMYTVQQCYSACLAKLSVNNMMTTKGKYHVCYLNEAFSGQALYMYVYIVYVLSKVSVKGYSLLYNTRLTFIHENVQVLLF